MFLITEKTWNQKRCKLCELSDTEHACPKLANRMWIRDLGEKVGLLISFEFNAPINSAHGEFDMQEVELDDPNNWKVQRKEICCVIELKTLYDHCKQDYIENFSKYIKLFKQFVELGEYYSILEKFDRLGDYDYNKYIKDYSNIPHDMANTIIHDADKLHDELCDNRIQWKHGAKPDIPKPIMERIHYIIFNYIGELGGDCHVYSEKIRCDIDRLRKCKKHKKPKL